MHAFVQCRTHRVHSCGAVFADGQRRMLVAEIPDVVGEDIGADPQFGTAAELVRSHHLAMLQHVARIGPGMSPGRGRERVQRDRGRLVAIDVDMHLHAMFLHRRAEIEDQFRRGVPDPVGLTADIAGPFDPRSPALNRSVGHQFDRAQAQLVGGPRLHRQRTLGDVLGCCADGPQGRNDAQVEIRRAGDFQKPFQIAVFHCGKQIGHGGHASQPADIRIGANRRFGEAERTEIGADAAHHREHRGHFLQFAGGFARIVLDHADRVGFAAVARHFQRLGVGAHQVEVRIDDRHRPVVGDPVEMMAVQAFGGQKDRVEAPADQRFAFRQGVGLPAQPCHHRVDIRHAFVQVALRVDPVVIAGIGKLPHRAGHHVGVALDKAGHQHRVFQRGVVIDRSPGIGTIRAADGEDAPVADGDMSRLRAAGVQGDDFSGFEHGCVGHRRLSFSSSPSAGLNRDKIDLLSGEG